MSPARYIVGDTREVTATLPDNSVDLVLTSPPFLALRSYLPADHLDKHKEIGSEPTQAAFIDVLLELTAEWERVLAPHGSICVELGDTYSGSGGENHLYEGSAPERGFHGAINQGTVAGVKRDTSNGWPLAKSLCLIPELYRIALAYGINPLTGKESPAGKWRVRNVVRWHRPNPPVGALGDKFRPATTDLVVACKSKDRYFDLDAVREMHAADPRTGPRDVHNGAQEAVEGWKNGAAHHGTNPSGAPPLDTWTIPTSPYKGAHYATWPPDLCVKPIKAMVPQKVCLKCGEPSRRIVEIKSGRDDGKPKPSTRSFASKRDYEGTPGGLVWTTHTTLGFTDCNHNNWRPGVVLDPFAGTGTTLAVATGHGRDAIGIDIDERSADLARERVGMFLTVEHFEKETA